mmetsp:Transcript_39069/g.117436  ORF Transcript_39069/g.117436 Transcript_39069/m.117436 type:complete len:221 (-) Transcript_39069:303-965(-)
MQPLPFVESFSPSSRPFSFPVSRLGVLFFSSVPFLLFPPEEEGAAPSCTAAAFPSPSPPPSFVFFDSFLSLHTAFFSFSSRSESARCFPPRSGAAVCFSPPVFASSPFAAIPEVDCSPVPALPFSTLLFAFAFAFAFVPFAAVPPGFDFDFLPTPLFCAAREPSNITTLAARRALLGLVSATGGRSNCRGGWAGGYAVTAAAAAAAAIALPYATAECGWR